MAARLCPKCKAERPLDHFERTNTGASRRHCKDCALPHGAPNDAPQPSRCNRCGKGPDVVTFQWRTDKARWRTTCTTCINGVGYSRASRARIRAADPEAYVARNTATHARWVASHKDAIAQHRLNRALNATSRLKDIRTSAKQRKIAFDDGSWAAMHAKLAEPCHYCGHLPAEGAAMNGLDRVDSDGGYDDGNTVTCCSLCNQIKAFYDVDVFVDNVRRIHAWGGAPPSVDAGVRPRAFGGDEARRRATKDKADGLPLDVKIDLWSAPCHLCGRCPSFGIDRIDSNVGYAVENCEPCCSDCNFMKKDLAADELRAHVGRVHEHTARWTLRDVASFPLRVPCGRREPLALVDASGDARVVFPSVGKAQEILGVPLCKASMIEGRRWAPATVRQCREFAMEPHAFGAFVKAVRCRFNDR